MKRSKAPYILIIRIKDRESFLHQREKPLGLINFIFWIQTVVAYHLWVLCFVDPHRNYLHVVRVAVAACLWPPTFEIHNVVWLESAHQSPELLDRKSQIPVLVRI